MQRFKSIWHIIAVCGLPIIINKQKHFQHEYCILYLSHCQMNKQSTLFHWTRTRVAQWDCIHSFKKKMKPERHNLLKFSSGSAASDAVYVLVSNSLRQMNWMKHWACLYCSFFAENSMVLNNLMLADWKSQKICSVRNLWPWTPSASNSIIYLVSAITVSHFW